MNIEVTGPYIYFSLPFFGGINITQTAVSSIVVTILLCWAFIYFGKNLKKRPDGKQVLVEKGVMMLQDMVIGTMGEHNLHWTPFIGTIFLSSIFGSFIGLTGFLRSTTADLSCVAVWSVMVSIIIWYNNIKYKGFLGWLKGFTEPIAVMTPMNIVSEFAQPLSMAFRHFGNVAGGGVITSIIYAALSLASTMILNLLTASGWIVSGVLILAGALMVWRWKTKGKLVWLIFGCISAVLGLFGVLQATNILRDVPILSYGIPAVLSCYFDLFSGFVQAYVFTLLTMVYISGSLPEPQQNTTSN